jgi:hypothetical protein
MLFEFENQCWQEMKNGGGPPPPVGLSGHLDSWGGNRFVISLVVFPFAGVDHYHYC